jgi:hypothetical protein
MASSSSRVAPFPSSIETKIPVDYKTNTHFPITIKTLTNWFRRVTRGPNHEYVTTNPEIWDSFREALCRQLVTSNRNNSLDRPDLRSMTHIRTFEDMLQACYKHFLKDREKNQYHQCYGESKYNQRYPVPDGQESALLLMFCINTIIDRVSEVLNPNIQRLEDGHIIGDAKERLLHDVWVDPEIQNIWSTQYKIYWQLVKPTDLIFEDLPIPVSRPPNYHWVAYWVRIVVLFTTATLCINSIEQGRIAWGLIGYYISNTIALIAIIRGIIGVYIAYYPNGREGFRNVGSNFGYILYAFGLIDNIKDGECLYLTTSKNYTKKW